jgi:hypothetical protein
MEDAMAKGRGLAKAIDGKPLLKIRASKKIDRLKDYFNLAPRAQNSQKKGGGPYRRFSPLRNLNI